MTNFLLFHDFELLRRIKLKQKSGDICYQHPLQILPICKYSYKVSNLSYSLVFFTRKISRVNQ